MLDNFHNPEFQGHTKNQLEDSYKGCAIGFIGIVIAMMILMVIEIKHEKPVEEQALEQIQEQASNEYVDQLFYDDDIITKLMTK